MAAYKHMVFPIMFTSCYNITYFNFAHVLIDVISYFCTSSKLITFIRICLIFYDFNFKINGSIDYIVILLCGHDFVCCNAIILLSLCSSTGG